MPRYGEFSGIQLRMIPYLLEAPFIEEVCKCARERKGRIYEWLKDKAFNIELR